ncbi:hypothetical protein [Arenimonas sp.]|uniref:hypothetical protein n=1 Tax=Arenimonas sp. TaxID=1872635 RepID=UPI0025C5B919|nr:hypothetical protein [Arenimonas sp.]
MSFIRRSLIACLVIGFGLAPVAAIAQQTGEQFYRSLVESSGYGSRMMYETTGRGVLDTATGQEWGGLQVEVVFGEAPGTGYGGYIYVVRNLSGEDYCIRTAYAFEPGQRYDRIQAPAPGNYLLPAGELQLATVVQGLGAGRRSLAAGIAYWRPDRSRERACSDVAPAGVEEWSSSFAWGDGLTFTGSRR